MHRDYRVDMTLDQFTAITIHAEDPIDEYYVTLIDGNMKFSAVREEYPRTFEDIRLIPQLTTGQQTLILLGVFDGQVCNGGITQFLWNYPEFIFPVRDAIERLCGESAILAHYDIALNELGEKYGGWEALRDEFRAAGANPDWETFRKSYDLLDLAWFEKAYFDRRGYNDRQEWVVQERGVKHPFMTRLADYVRTHPTEFITGEPAPGK